MSFKIRRAGVQATIDALLEEMDSIPTRQLQALVPVLAEAQAEVEAALRRSLARAGEPSFGSQSLRSVYVQLGPALERVRELNPELVRTLRDGRRDARGLAHRHVLEELVQLSSHFEGTLPAGLNLAAAAKIAEGSKTLLARYRRFGKSYSQDTERAIRRSLGVSISENHSFEQAARRMAKRVWGENSAQPTGAYFRALRIVRTEVLEQYNDQAAASIRQVARLDDEIMQRWDASLDSRVCVICRELHGVVVRPGEMFPDGIDHPPAHAQCRCSIIAWRSDWSH